MAEQVAVDGEYPDLLVIEEEIGRWLGQHALARSIFQALPPEQQAAIVEQGQPSVVPLTALVGCKPEIRELAATILQRLLEDCRTIRTSATPWVVEPGRPGLSHPLSTVGQVGGDDDTTARMDRIEERMASLEALGQEILSLLRARPGSGGTAAPAGPNGPPPD